MNRQPLARRYDAVVVGARVAGAATAMLLARSGLHVLLVDRSEYGADTLSTHALMRAGVLQLQRWGVLPNVIGAGTPPVTLTTFHYADETVAVPIEPRHGVDRLFAPRRTVLDRLLVDAAKSDGVQVRYGMRLTDIVRTAGGRVTGIVALDESGSLHTVETDVVIGADGLRSAVARLVGAEAYRLGRHASGSVYGYWSGLDVDGYHWHYRPGVSTGVIPTNDGETLLFASIPSARYHAVFGQSTADGYLNVVREASPQLASRVAAATLRSRLASFSGQVGHFRQSHGPGWALVGDAGYFKDPITAHGISDALRDAELLASAVVAGTSTALADYQRERDELSVDLFNVTDEIASFGWDLETIGPLLKALARAMSHEVKMMAARFDALLAPGDELASPSHG
jgi:2-polyprenyl-6-methoxyphenol hydroxylase-like FAD-dependent oxidoreductase